MDDFKNTFDSENHFEHDVATIDAPVAFVPEAVDVAQDDQEPSGQTEDSVLVSSALDVVISSAVVTPTPSTAKPMQKRRFLMGLLTAGGGIGLMLCVAVGALQSAGASGHLSLPAVSICMVVGLMLLGGGFGVMATAAPKFDDDEFDRLLRMGGAPHDQHDGDLETVSTNVKSAADGHSQPRSSSLL